MNRTIGREIAECRTLSGDKLRVDLHMLLYGLIGQRIAQYPFLIVRNLTWRGLGKAGPRHILIKSSCLVQAVHQRPIRSNHVSSSDSGTTDDLSTSKSEPWLQTWLFFGRNQTTAISPFRLSFFCFFPAGACIVPLYCALSVRALRLLALPVCGPPLGHAPSLVDLRHWGISCRGRLRAVLQQHRRALT